MTQALRLNRFLARAGVASRRRCDALISEGRVTVNGEVVSELGGRIQPDSDSVCVDGKVVTAEEESVSLAFHKPPNVLVAAVDPRGRRIVMDFLTEVPVRVFPVGRLDFRSEGLLLFTNDGDLAYRLAHPAFKVEKVYLVEVLGGVAPAVVDALRRGVRLEDGPTQPARVRIVEREKRFTRLEVTLREGRKRQVRRMFALFGLEVTRLVRTQVGSLTMGSLAPGKWRPLTETELDGLRSAVFGPELASGEDVS
ncbi:MAG: pseudouridine synthase [Gemmatimonadota bacterium]|jgi:pseudouridine synthase|nr:pseudouridine synthase [Gemmatimonadota bacterium]MDP6461471.1 pseudouridine synthase [Gemmatimonadota bacterium]MDP6529986.1 pseudouridine synthase [Gemmatimonadota bacterium]MDP6802109.1 pseudouridine synthase [Gemmatimonadota bacterium]MDP7032043.1 pseudouridine synthase [Gemmatimonadota bacterium]